MIQLIVAVTLVSLVLWLFHVYVPAPPPVKMVLEVVVSLVLILWILSALGITHGHLAVPAW